MLEAVRQKELERVDTITIIEAVAYAKLFLNFCSLMQSLTGLTVRLQKRCLK